LLLPALTTPAIAQTVKKPALPLFVAIQGVSNGDKEGDLYAFINGALRKRTNYGFNQEPITAPDGQSIGFNSVVQSYTELRDDKHYVFPVPSNISILNTATFAARSLTNQTAQAPNADGPAFTLRSAPSWSPSGRQLAWTEIDVVLLSEEVRELTPERLIVYDLDTETSRVIIPELPKHTVVNATRAMSALAWGYPGIAVITYLPGDDDAQRVALYTSSGTLLWEYSSEESLGFRYSSAIWVQRSDGTYDLTSIEGQYRFDAKTGTLYIPACLTPELYSPLAPKGVSMFYNETSSGEGDPVWVIAVNGVVKTEMAAAGRYYFTSGIAIAPDGTQGAYIVYPGQGTDGGLYFYKMNSGKVRLSANGVNGIACGPTAWRWRSFANPGDACAPL